MGKFFSHHLELDTRLKQLKNHKEYLTKLKFHPLIEFICAVDDLSAQLAYICL